MPTAVAPRATGAPDDASGAPARGRVSARVAGIVALVLAIVAVSFVSVGVGPVAIPPGETLRSFVAFDPDDAQHLLAQLQRTPRTILGLLVGVCLGLAGAVMQALTRNPLAEPGILGVNGGAAFAIATGIAVGLTSVWHYTWLGLVGAAVAGAVVYLLGGARTGTNPVRLVLAGAASSAVLMAATQLVLVNASPDVFNRFRFWMVGSLSGRGYDVLAAVSVLAVVGIVGAVLLARALDAAVLGEDTARALGANPAVVWSVAGVVVIVLAGAATAAAGPVVFLGLAAPHLARLLVGASHRWVLPYSALIGALLVVGADALGRIVVPGREVSVGIMIAILGGPLFVWLVRRKRIATL
ncbi:FecCD family ABC transporter permease [Microbacterium sp. gxy059]|uniref:FecCD family ABC transporter permease n=1 Tax=Microbacterium sp. gxy059 TaxID=2957199 RepID=UPI003D992A6D